jgi:SAM-dependent methyltransferase
VLALEPGAGPERGAGPEPISPKPVAGRDLYDEPGFFARYQQLRAAAAGLNEALDQPSLARLLPPVADLDVTELGCGEGTLARRLARAGARSVLAVDAAARMLDRAAARPHRRVRYLRADIETLDLPDGGTDLVVCSLALHYVADYQGVLARVGRWLRPGGQLVFSCEHPVCTARDPMTGWLALAEGSTWPVDHYGRETARVQNWLGTPVVKHHRRLSTLVGGVLAAGLELTGLDEPQPDAATLAQRPDLAQHCRRPPLLLIAARKPAA